MKKGKKDSGSKKAQGQGTTFTNPDIYKTDPLKNQFEPTDATPINQHKRMAGTG